MKNLQPLPFADGGALVAANGYEPLAVELSEIALGHLQPTGPWGFGQDLRAIHAAAYATGVLPAKLPIEGTDFNAARARWCAGIRIDTDHEDVAEAVSGMVHRMTGTGPVQLSEHSPSRLLPFRINHTDARHFTMRTQYWRAGSASVEATGVCWLLQGAGLYWKDGVSLVDVKREDLPLLTLEAAHEIIRAADDGFAKLQPPAPKTERDLRVDAGVRHRLSCGVCARCVDAQPGEWVVVHDLSWPPCQILALDAAGEFTITGPDGKQYVCPGHRLFPTPAPVPVEKPRTETEILIGGFHRAPLAKA